MNHKRLALVVFLLLCAACVGQALYYYPRLPAEVARHFGAAGQPDAWCGKGQFLIFHLGTIAFLAGVFLGVGLVLRKLPAGFINLPNKEYWLAPERRQQTLDYLQPRFLWLGSLTMVFLLDAAGQTFQVHLGQAARLNHMWQGLGVFLAATATWGIALCAKFRKKDSGLPPA
jgi:hypothetical protein